jgi:hypothetical protein
LGVRGKAAGLRFHAVTGGFAVCAQDFFTKVMVKEKHMAWDKPRRSVSVRALITEELMEKIPRTGG